MRSVKVDLNYGVSRLSLLLWDVNLHSGLKSTWGQRALLSPSGVHVRGPPPVYDVCPRLKSPCCLCAQSKKSIGSILSLSESTPKPGQSICDHCAHNDC